MIRLERGLGLVLLLLPEPEETLDVRLAVRAVLPLAGRPPRELRRLRRALQRLPRVQQRLDVDSVVDARHSHGEPLSMYRRPGGSPGSYIGHEHCGETGDMIARMATPASKTAAGSVGTVETQFLDLPKPLELDCGRTLHPVRIAYETYGTLSPARDNVILVCHALSGDAHAAGFAKTPPPESTRDGFAAEDRDGTAGRGLGWWDGMIGPGKASTPIASSSSAPTCSADAAGRPDLRRRTRQPASRTDPTFR